MRRHLITSCELNTEEVPVLLYTMDRVFLELTTTKHLERDWLKKEIKQSCELYIKYWIPTGLPFGIHNTAALN